METIYALSSGRPPAAVSVIRISGSKAHDAGRRLAGELPEGRHVALRQLTDPATGEVLDDALVLRFDAPASATAEDVVEIQCHGGRAVVDSILTALGQIGGLREAQPGEFTRRAFENGRIDLTEAEGLADLLEAETEAQRKAALALAEGGLTRQVANWQERLLGLSAEAERAIDYDEDDELGIDPGLLRGCEKLLGELHEWLGRPRTEVLKDGVRVVVAGPVNAGKSSLINAIVGTERAIVSDVPGTTRDHIDVPLALGGLPILLTDTAGLRDTADRVEAIGIARASKLVGAADVLVWLGEPELAPQHPRLIKVHAKADLPGRETVPAGSIGVSSITGYGVSDILETVRARSKEVMPADGALSLNRRQAELVGEAVGSLSAALRAPDVVVLAESLRSARNAFDRLTGRAGVEDVLDALFGRFCLGK